jgi:hypothetical protein
VSEAVTVALIAAAPPTVAAILGYLANRRSLQRSVGTSPGIPLTKVLERLETRFEGRFDRLDAKVDRAADQQVRMRERIARLEAERAWPGEAG